MAGLLALLVVGQLCIAHAGEIVPALVVLSGVFRAKVPELAFVIPALRRSMGARSATTYMVARPFLRRTRRRFRVRLLDADIDKFRAVIEHVRHGVESMGARG